MLVAALTGDVGSGKSTAAKTWRSMGAHIIDADACAKEMWYIPDVIDAAAARWGDDIRRADGSPDFAKIASFVFSSEQEQSFTNDLIHPHAIAELERRARASGGWVCVEIPLLFETGVPSWVSCVVYATAPIELRGLRVASRGWSADEVRRRESLLLPRDEKISLADIVMDNSGTHEEWSATVRAAGERMKLVASAREATIRCSSPAAARSIARALIDEKLAARADIDAETISFTRRGEIRGAVVRALTTEKRSRAVFDVASNIDGDISFTSCDASCASFADMERALHEME